MTAPGARHATCAAGLRLLAVAVSLAASTECAGSWAGAHGLTARPLRTITSTVTLHGTPMTLHILSPPTPASPTIVVYATGDGGWFGTAVDVFRGIAAQGYRAVGFSARAFLRIERPPHVALNARQLAADYAAIVSRARAVLDAPAATPVILAGWSRGAAFAALAAAEPELHAQTRGVVAIGLAADEDLQVDEASSDDAPEAGSDARARPLLTYAHLRHLAPMRCAVIQSAHDDYLPAVKARALLGPDTAARRLYDVPSRNHRFSGGHDAFLAALTSALSWVDYVTPAAN